VLTSRQAFQQQIFHELREEDELLILARGLGLLRIVTNLLHAYDAAGNNLIIVLGADERESQWIGEALAEKATITNARKCRGLVTINTDTVTPQNREKLYGKTGIFCITSRILIVDLLSGLLDGSKITGMIVLHAEKVGATSVEAFIIREYRQKNRDGFLKAFSDTPEAFVSGFAPLANTLRNLFLRKPSLYPRFQGDVIGSLDGKKRAEVIELEVGMTDSMRVIQNAVLECIEASISELKKLNSGLEMEDWNLDSALQRNFYQIIMRQLDPVWHRTSPKSKQIVNDLRTLRDILHFVLTYDCISFLKYLDTVLANAQGEDGKRRQNPSPWLLLDAAHTMFQTAKQRVYKGDLVERPTTNGRANSPAANVVQPVLEELPKWEMLAEVLDEIERDHYYNPAPQDDSSGAILVMCGDLPTCSQLREYLESMHVKLAKKEDEDGEATEQKGSASFMLRRKLRNYVHWKRNFNRITASLQAESESAMSSNADAKANAMRGRAPASKRRRVRGGSTTATNFGRDDSGARTAGDRDAHIAHLLAELQVTAVEAQQKEEITADPLERMEDYYELYDLQDLLVVYPYDGDMDEHVLEEVRPRYIIMYEPDAAFIRRVEVYRSSHTDRNVRVYFMYYGGSVEEQRYLSTVRREKDAFTRLIKERGTMAITLDQAPNNPEEQFLRTINTRIAGGGRLAATAVQPRIVADMREFRSELPGLLHAQSIDVIPAQLTVGDYILTPHIAVERKSVSDLIGSFKSGRLFNQVETMLEHYKNPMLLIEFGDVKSFTLEPFADLTNSAAAAAMAAPDLQSKIVMLTIHFPRLRIIWSSSPYQTVQIFEELKKQQEEPDPYKAVMIGLEEGENPDTGRIFNQDPMDMLRTIPGITEKNIVRLSLQINSIQDLANADEGELDAMVGRDVGRQIWRFFNRELIED
jgi:DNA excision repair protein ERCC-4